jgi:hypothetical protein
MVLIRVLLGLKVEVSVSHKNKDDVYIFACLGKKVTNMVKKTEIYVKLWPVLKDSHRLFLTH